MNKILKFAMAAVVKFQPSDRLSDLLVAGGADPESYQKLKKIYERIMGVLSSDHVMKKVFLRFIEHVYVFSDPKGIPEYLNKDITVQEGAHLLVGLYDKWLHPITKFIRSLPQTVYYSSIRKYGKNSNILSMNLYTKCNAMFTENVETSYLPLKVEDQMLLEELGAIIDHTINIDTKAMWFQPSTEPEPFSIKNKLTWLVDRLDVVQQHPEMKVYSSEIGSASYNILLDDGPTYVDTGEYLRYAADIINDVAINLNDRTRKYEKVDIRRHTKFKICRELFSIFGLLDALADIDYGS